MSVEAPLIRDMLNGHLNSRIEGSQFGAAFDNTKLTQAEYTIFLATGTNPVTNYSWPPGDVRRYGVIGDGVTNDTVALQTAADFCKASGVPISGFAGTCKVTSTITLNCIGNLGALTVTAASASVSPVIRIGTTSGAPILLNGALRLPMVTNSSYVAGAGWSGFGIGIDLGNLYQSQLHIPHVYGFLIGIYAGGYDEGLSYNVILMEMISSNQIGLRLGGKASTAWANQNVFIGGRFFIPSSEGTAISGSRHIQLVPNDITSGLTADVSWPNNNTFINQSIEGDGPEWPLSLSGNNNKFINVRFESTSPKMLFLGHATLNRTFENDIDGGYASRTMAVTVSGIAFYNAVNNPRGSSIGGDGSCLNIRNDGSGADPLIQGFEPTEAFFNATNAAANWSVRMSARKLEGKTAAGSTALVELDFQNGYVKGGQLRANANATGLASHVTFGVNTQSTVGAAGGASALPATPSGYLRFFLGTTEFVLPYYARV